MTRDRCSELSDLTLAETRSLRYGRKPSEWMMRLHPFASLAQLESEQVRNGAWLLEREPKAPMDRVASFCNCQHPVAVAKLLDTAPAPQLTYPALLSFIIQTGSDRYREQDDPAHDTWQRSGPCDERRGSGHDEGRAQECGRRRPYRRNEVPHQC
jgi:hypothetical protein